jgi:hypothetical protein
MLRTTRGLSTVFALTFASLPLFRISLGALLSRSDELLTMSCSQRTSRWANSLGWTTAGFPGRRAYSENTGSSVQYRKLGILSLRRFTFIRTAFSSPLRSRSLNSHGPSINGIIGTLKGADAYPIRFQSGRKNHRKDRSLDSCLAEEYKRM